LLKAVGYLISSVSVVLLGIVSWKSASEHPLTSACLVLGMLTSVGGMVCRWLSFRADERPAKPESPPEMVEDAQQRVSGARGARFG
jgi:hypothetical protein